MSQDVLESFVSVINCDSLLSCFIDIFGIIPSAFGCDAAARILVEFYLFIFSLLLDVCYDILYSNKIPLSPPTHMHTHTTGSSSKS